MQVSVYNFKPLVAGKGGQLYPLDCNGTMENTPLSAKGESHFTYN